MFLYRGRRESYRARRNGEGGKRHARKDARSSTTNQTQNDVVTDAATAVGRKSGKGVTGGRYKTAGNGLVRGPL